ncbi:MAG: mechanosensitive ion channel family protein [Bacteroidetes bacterium]|nr:mechanosensitive ion channel family protein [Bacteroidota bacterium]
MENLIIKLCGISPLLQNYYEYLNQPLINKIVDDIFDIFNNNSFFTIEFLGNYVFNYIVFAIVFVALMLLIKPLLKLIFTIFRKLASKTKSNSDDKILNYFLEKKSSSFISLEIVVVLYLSLKVLWLSPQVQNVVDSLAIIFITIFIVSVIIDVIKYTISSRYGAEGDPRGNSLLLIFPIIKIVIWVLAGFFVLSNLGYDVSALLAGLGIGGVAFALASQSFLSDLISFISIISDKPIEIGDYISINGIEGTVKKIGIKSTRIERNLGEEVIIPNSKITGSDLFNYKRLDKRRFDIVLQINPNTANEKLQLIPDIVNKLIAENEMLQLVRCSLDTIGDFSYNFTTIIYVLTDDGATYFKLKEDFIYKIKTELETNNINLAYPIMEIAK